MEVSKESASNPNSHLSADREVTRTVISGALDTVITTKIQLFIHKATKINAPCINHVLKVESDNAFPSFIRLFNEVICIHMNV